MFLTLNFDLVCFVWLVEKIESRERKSERAREMKPVAGRQTVRRKRKRRERRQRKETGRRQQGD